LRKPEVLKEFASAYSSTQLLVLPLDITKLEQIKAAFASAIEKFGRIDIVVNNAGHTLVAEAEGTVDEAAKYLFEVNFWGMANMTREAIRVFRDINKPIGGKILTISSEAGVEGWGTLSYYGASYVLHFLI
jgi:NAD(P)-dependent dehydrogenase (short-subunit alcohol dehydrogenase family)